MKSIVGWKKTLHNIRSRAAAPGEHPQLLVGLCEIFSFLLLESLPGYLCLPVCGSENFLIKSGEAVGETVRWWLDWTADCSPIMEIVLYLIIIRWPVTSIQRIIFHPHEDKAGQPPFWLACQSWQVQIWSIVVLNLIAGLCLTERSQNNWVADHSLSFPF